jgi:hypothetical protein
MITPNILMAKALVNEFEVDTEQVEQVAEKQLKLITTPNRETRILDLVRVEFRYIVDGSIHSDDEDKFWELFDRKGVFPFSYKGVDYLGNIEKLSITNSSKREDPNMEVKFTLIRGTNIGSS